MTIEFLKPALMDDELCVETHPSAIRGVSIDMTRRKSDAAAKSFWPRKSE